MSVALAQALDQPEEAADMMEEALIEACECTGGLPQARGIWTLTSGLWRFPAEETANGALLPALYSIAHSYSEDTLGRRSEPQTVDWIAEEEKLLVEVSLLSSKAACDAWVECFLALTQNDDRRGAARSLTPDGWVAVTWRTSPASLLLYIERAYPGVPVVRSAIGDRGVSLTELTGRRRAA